jgi:hypothetical protein
VIDKRRHFNKKDSLGRSLEPGVRVAFNYSGNVASGTIEKITPSEIHILRDEGFSGGTNRISKVKNARSCLVLHGANVTSALNEQMAMLEARSTQAEAELRGKYNERLITLKDQLTDIICKIGDAWDLDEVQMFVEERYGPGVTDEDQRAQILVEKVLDATTDKS